MACAIPSPPWQVTATESMNSYKMSRILGHSGIQVTLDIYHDYVPSQDEQLVGMITDRLSLGPWCLMQPVRDLTERPFDWRNWETGRLPGSLLWS